MRDGSSGSGGHGGGALPVGAAAPPPPPPSSTNTANSLPGLIVPTVGVPEGLSYVLSRGGAPSINDIDGMSLGTGGMRMLLPRHSLAKVALPTIEGLGKGSIRNSTQHSPLSPLTTPLPFPPTPHRPLQALPPMGGRKLGNAAK